MKKSQFIVFGIVLIVLCVGGYFVFSYFEEWLPSSPTFDTYNLPPNSSTTGDNISDSMVKDPYAGWKIYTNEKYGYSIHYPGNWYVDTRFSNRDFSTRGSGDVMGGDTLFANYENGYDYDITNMPRDFDSIQLLIYKTDPKIVFLDDYVKTINFVGLYTKEDIMIHGVPGLKLTFSKDREQPSADAVVFLKINDRVFNFSIRDSAIKELITNSFRPSEKNMLLLKLLNQHFPPFGIVDTPFAFINGGYKYSYCGGKMLGEEDCKNNPIYQNTTSIYLDEGVLSFEKTQNGIYYVATIVTFNAGGTGQYKYLVLLNGTPDSDLSYVASVDLGDRVQIHSISFSEGKIVLDMNIHGPNDGLCCPSVRTTKIFELQGGNLMEVH